MPDAARVQHQLLFDHSQACAEPQFGPKSVILGVGMLGPFMQLNHLHLHVRNVGVAKGFYSHWFGFQDHVQHGEILFLRDAAGLDLALAPDANPGAMPAWFHFGFRLESADAVRTMFGAMQAADVAMAKPLKDFGDFVVFRCADPDGYEIEIYWE